MVSTLLKTWLVAGAIAVGFSSSAWAQQNLFAQYGGHRVGDPTAGTPTDCSGFDRLTDDFDFDFFNHVDCGSYDNIPANTGPFFTYDRMYVNVLRPDRSIRPHVGDWTWGNRFDFGYRNDSGVGLLGSVFKLNDPDGGRGMQNSVAIAGGEAMATFRFTNKRSLVQFEPMIGMRFEQFVDHGDTRSIIDQITNNMFGPQGGFRLSLQQGSVTLSTEARFFSAWNYSEYYRFDDSTWAPVGELRAECTYEVFKQAALRFGYSGQVIGDGLSRDASNTRKEDTFIQGLTFGFVINR